jgi:hypothetical protein
MSAIRPVVLHLALSILVSVGARHDLLLLVCKHSQVWSLDGFGLYQGTPSGVPNAIPLYFVVPSKAGSFASE